MTWLNIIWQTIYYCGLTVGILVALWGSALLIMLPLGWLGERLGDLFDRLDGLDPKTGRPRKWSDG